MAPTARLLGDVAEFLRSRGHAVEIISQDDGGGTAAGSYREQGGRAAGGGGRLRRELLACVRLLAAGWRARVGGERPEVVLALSSPPCLLVLAAVVAARHRAALAHWAMDLYPELARALGEIGPGPLFRLLRAAMGWGYRRAGLVVALDEDMRDHLRKTYGVEARVLAPWARTRGAGEDGGGAGPGSEGSSDPEADPAAAAGDAPWTWLYSGNLGRAHEWETLLEAQRRLEDWELPIHLVFQGGGNVRPAAQARAAALGLRRCHWRGYVDEDALMGSLLAARVLIVTQRPETRGLLWPSKLAAVGRLPRPILWVGPMDGAIAQRLAAARPPGRGGGQVAGSFAPGEAEAVARWVEAQFRPPMSAGLPNPTEVEEGEGEELDAEAGCRALETWLLEAAKR